MGGSSSGLLGRSQETWEVVVRNDRVKLEMDSTRHSKGAKIINRYNQVPHLTQYTKGKVTN